MWVSVIVGGHFVPDNIYRHTGREERAIRYPLGSIKKRTTDKP